MKNVDMNIIESIINKRINDPEQRRFKTRSFFKHHLNVYQDFNEVKFSIYFSHTNADEYNCIVGLFILFWGFEIIWNSRRE